jgi:hypothetical protein
LYLARPNEPALIQGEIGFQRRRQPPARRYDAFLWRLAAGPALAAEAQYFLLPQQVLQAEVAKIRIGAEAALAA